MVIELIALLSLAPSQQAVVRLARGPVAITSTGASTVVDTGGDGFAEVHLPRIARLRLSTATRAVIGRDQVNLISGRLWAQVGGASRLAIHTARNRIEIAAKSSAIVERTTGGGMAIVVRTGKAVITDREGAKREVPEGHTLRVDSGVAGLPEARLGGRGTAELVTIEARRAMRDPIGFEEFLLSRSIEGRLAERAARGVEQQVRSASELTGSEGGAHGALLEDAFRPPPFFEAEVPPKGPNVRVSVSFGGE
jgi:hypothetical protein